MRGRRGARPATGVPVRSIFTLSLYSADRTRSAHKRRQMMDGSWNPLTNTMRFFVDARLCGITREALENRGGATEALDRPALHGVFRKYQEEFERVAAQKIKAGEFEEEGSPF